MSSSGAGRSFQSSLPAFSLDLFLSFALCPVQRLPFAKAHPGCEDHPPGRRAHWLRAGGPEKRGPPARRSGRAEPIGTREMFGQRCPPNGAHFLVFGYLKALGRVTMRQDPSELRRKVPRIGDLPLGMLNRPRAALKFSRGRMEGNRKHINHLHFRVLSFPTSILWTDEILHHFDTMVETNVCWYLCWGI